MTSRYFANHLTDFVASESAIARLNAARQHFKEKTMETAAICVKKVPANSANIDGGLYVGIAGLAYGLWYAASKRTIFDEKEQNFLLTEARRLIEYNLKHDLDVRGEEGGFLLGASGIYVTAALIFREFKDDTATSKYLDKLKKLAEHAAEKVHFLRHGNDEIFVGRAGYLCAILNAHLKIQPSIFNNDLIKSLIKSIVDSGREYSKNHRSPSPLMYAYHGTEYLGAAHGLTGILQMALSFPNVNADEFKSSVDWLCSVQLKNGNFPCSTDELDYGELVHWCHGAPGTVYLLARAYQIWHDERYLKAALQCGDLVWTHGLLKKGQGICHGIAGNAYVFLLLYRLTGYKDERQLHRALQFVEFMDTKEFKNGARTPDMPYSLFEGLAGTMCLYADLASGEEGRDGWEFPLMPVFF